MSLDARLRAAREGVPGADKRLIEGIQTQLYRYFAVRFSSTDVEDLIQNTIEIVLLSLGTLSPEVPFERWLQVVARNVANREYYARAQRARLGQALEHHPAKSQMGPSSALLLAEHGEILQEEIQQLPEGMRVVIEHDLANGDPAELAKSHRLRPTTVRTRRKRATDQLTRDVRGRAEATAVSKLTDDTPSTSR